MKSLDEIKSVLARHKNDLKIKYNVKKIQIFGSYVRGENKENSDLDILVEFEKPISLIKFLQLENYLSNILGIKVDLVMKKSLKPYIKKQALKEAINI